MFDLPAFVLGRLAEAGVTRTEWIGRDTCAEEVDFFSNRRAVKRGEGDYGRLMSAIMLDRRRDGACVGPCRASASAARSREATADPGENRP